jgi:hypothetical protein
MKWIYTLGALLGMGMIALISFALPISVDTTPTPQVITEQPTSAAITDYETWMQLPQQEIDGVLFRHYATVHRTDGTYRQMFITEETLSNWQQSEALPSDAFIVMETYYTPEVESTNFTKLLTEDEFHYGSFSPNRPNFDTRPNNSCMSCHSGAADALGTFTLPMLQAAVNEGLVTQTLCDRSGRTPCGDEVYEQFNFVQDEE